MEDGAAGEELGEVAGVGEERIRRGQDPAARARVRVDEVAGVGAGADLCYIGVDRRGGEVAGDEDLAQWRGARRGEA